MMEYYYLLLLLVFSSHLRSTPNGIKFMEIKFCLTVQSHLHQIQYIHMAHGFPPPCCTGKKFIQDENGKIVCPFFY
jgi:hypothetical protein